MRPIHFVSCLLISSLFSINGYSAFWNRKQQSCGKAPNQARLAIRHIEANGIGYNRGYTTLEIFFSPYEPIKNRWVPFIDLRGHVFNDGHLAANAGIGLRYLSSHHVYGINTYYDCRSTHHRSYHQGALGLEMLGERWDFRWNGYLPFGSKTSSHYGLQFDHFENHYLVQSRKHEFAMSGTNAEAGIHLFPFKHIPFYLAAGPYYLTGNKTAWGGEARLAIDCSDYIRLEGSTSYDHLFKWIGQGQLSLVIPLGREREVTPIDAHSCSSWLTLNERSVQRIDRNEIIPVDHKRSKSIAIDPTTDLPYFFLFVNNLSHSAGTFESPFSTLVDAQNASNSNDIIYVFPGDGTTTGMDQGFIMKDSQHLWGSGATQSLPTTWGSVKVPALTIGLPKVTQPLVGEAIIQLANDCEVSGINLTSTTSSVGIEGSSITNAFIHNNQIDFNNIGDVDTSGIKLSTQGTIDISNNIVNIGPITHPSHTAIAGFLIDYTDKIKANISNNIINIEQTETGTSDLSGIYIAGPYNENQININQNKFSISNSGTISNTLSGFYAAIGGVIILNQNESIISNFGTTNGVMFGFQISNSGTNEQVSLIQNRAIINNSATSSAELNGVSIFNSLNTPNAVQQINLDNNEIVISNSGTNTDIQGIFAQDQDGINEQMNLNKNQVIISNSGTSTNIYGFSAINDANSSQDTPQKIGLSQNTLTISSATSITGDFEGFIVETGVNTNVNSASCSLYQNQAIIQQSDEFPIGFNIVSGGTGIFSLNLINNFSAPNPIRNTNADPSTLRIILNSQENYPPPGP